MWLSPVVCVNYWTALLPLIIFFCRSGKLCTQRMVRSRRFQRLCSLRGTRLYICFPCLSLFQIFRFFYYILYLWFFFFFNFRFWCFICYWDSKIMFNSILYFWFVININDIKRVNTKHLIVKHEMKSWSLSSSCDISLLLSLILNLSTYI